MTKCALRSSLRRAGSRFQNLKGIQILEKVKLSDAMTELFFEQEKKKTFEVQVAQLKRQLTEKDASFASEIDALRLASDMFKLEEVRGGRWARLAAEEACDAMQVERYRALPEIASLRKTVANRDAHIIQLEERCRTETVRVSALSIERGRHFRPAPHPTTIHLSLPVT